MIPCPAVRLVFPSAPVRIAVRYGGEWRSPTLAAFSMSQLPNVNPTSEHEIYLTLFVTNGGGVPFCR